MRLIRRVEQPHRYCGRLGCGGLLVFKPLPSHAGFVKKEAHCIKCNAIHHRYPPIAWEYYIDENGYA